MSLTKLEEIVTTLEAELEELDGQIDETEHELRKLKDSKRQIGRAMRSLGAETVAPSPTGKLVTPLVERLLRENDALSEEDLYDLARDELSDDGIGASGLKLRLHEALDKIDGVKKDPQGCYTLSGSLTAVVAG